MELTNDSSSIDKSEMDLELAIRSNNLISLQEVLLKGANVNWQNCDGNTALHIAVSEDAGIDILRTLMENGATVAVENNDNKTPVQCLKPTSLQTVANLLKLEKCFDFRDSNNNSLMHVFMARDMKFDKEDFWKMIVTEYEHLNIDFNSQNKSGATPLMLAGQDFEEKNLKYVLDNVDNLDLFVMDSNSDTFLHVYMHLTVGLDLDFFTTLLQGKTKYCPKLVVKKLLNSQNYEKDTPFHKFLRNITIPLKVYLLQLFINAGADVNSCNTFGRTVLHGIFRYMYTTDPRTGTKDEEDQNTKYLVKCGADIDAQDCYGDSPLFLANDVKSVGMLIKLGANVNIQNKFGQTPLIKHALYPYKHFKVFNKLIAAGADVNIKDHHGSTVLHYAAWVDFKILRHIVPYFLLNDCAISHDALGHLPCHKAYESRNKEMFKLLCKCDKAVHGSSDNFKFRKKRVKLADLEDINQFVNDFQCYQGSGISKLLVLPRIGSVVFEQEAKMIRLAVNDFVRNLCHEISIRDELLTPLLVHSGSIRENTKVGFPDEYDFVCILKNLSDKCEIDDLNTIDESGFAVLKLKTEFICHENQECLFAERGHLVTSHVWERFNSVMKDVFKSPEFFCHPNIRYIEDCATLNYVTSPTFACAIFWNGCFYKDFSITIDLALACCVKGYWPKNANIDKLTCDVQQLREEGSLLLIQTELENRLNFPQNVRVSSLNAEIKHMDSIPDIAKDAYRICKICCDSRICPGLVVNNTVDVKEILSSYMLKNCMFHVLEKYQKADFHDISPKPYKDKELFKFVGQIFHTLLEFLNEENLPSFIFPWQNIFTFRVVNNRTVEKSHVRCSYMKVFVKFILRLFGEKVDFTDIDTGCLSEYRANDRYGYEAIFFGNDNIFSS